MKALRFGLLVALCLLLNIGCGRNPSPTTKAPVPTSDSGEKSSALTPVTTAADGPIEEQVAGFCGNCHATPKPDIFPRDAWPTEIERGFGLYFESRRSDLKVPRIVDVVRYYRERAPQTLDIPLPPPEEAPPPVRFRQAEGEMSAAALLPATSNLRFVPARDDEPAALLLCDMRGGDVRRVTLGGQPAPGVLLAQLANPAHVEECDLDHDGQFDLIVAELGSMDPADHGDGRVFWLRWDSEKKSYAPHVLADQLGRVADMRAADFDGDGDLDLVVAEFGWHRTGKVFLLWNHGCTVDKTDFRPQIVERHPGAIHVPTCDLNGDGLIDFLALISQDQEMVLAFLNQGDGTFRRQLVWQADDPSFGSSGIELVDLDQDGDLDLLYTNGDTFDNRHIKPYHGVHWLRNDGGFPFQHQVIGKLPGAYRALAGDIDGDGDLDVVAAAFLPHEPLTAFDAARHHSLILLEQTGPDAFRRHGLETGHFDHATLVLNDLDGDGDLDLAVGEFPRNATAPHPRFRFWWNDGPIAKPATPAKP